MSTTTKSRAVILRDYEIKSLLADGTVEVRRPVKPQPHECHNGDLMHRDRLIGSTMPDRSWVAHGPYEEAYGVCPFDAPGTVLAVKEAFWAKHDTDSDGFYEIDCGPCLDIGPEFNPGIQYCATPASEDPPPGVSPAGVSLPGNWWEGPPDEWDGKGDYRGRGVWEFHEWGLFTRFSALVMPAWASRLRVENTAVSVERIGGVWTWVVSFRRLDADRRPG